VFERFPDETGQGVFFSIVHGIEHIGGYEEELLRSVYRKPSHGGVSMIHRMQNTGQTTINEKDIKALYKELLERSDLSDRLRKEIKDYL
jgi:hypothetical protein